jgi:AraC-like DNA-binding protein
MSRRLQQALQLLVETELRLSEIANTTGFADQSHFSRQFRKYIGVAPSTYRRSRR